MKIQDLIVEIAERKCDVRPYRLENESTADYRKSLGDAAPSGPFSLDIAPGLEPFSKFVALLTSVRLTNVNRDMIEVDYRTGFWDDAWDGFFYYPALLISHILAYDMRLSKTSEFADSLRYFHGVRAFRKGHYLFLKKGPMEASYVDNALTLPVDSLSAGSDDPNIHDLSALFGSKIVEDLRKWINVSDDQKLAEDPVSSPSGLVDVFLSHSSKDAIPAKEFADALTASGKRVFFSADSLPALGSADYMKAIDEALEAATHFVLFGTKRENFLSSWVEAEWRLFIQEKRSGRKSGNFVTVVAGGLSPADLPMAVRYYEVIPAEGDFVQRVLRYLT